MTAKIRELHNEDKKSIKNIFALYWHDQEFLDRLSMRLESAIENTFDCIEQRLIYSIAEEDEEVVGVLGFRKAPPHMFEFVKTKNPTELYIVATKKPGNGIGKILIEKMIEDTKKLGYTEIVLYSGETHKEFWGFYDHLDFERVSPATAPNGELGQIWRKLLI